MNRKSMNGLYGSIALGGDLAAYSGMVLNMGMGINEAYCVCNQARMSGGWSMVTGFNQLGEVCQF